jgi:hypothetical protein
MILSPNISQFFSYHSHLRGPADRCPSGMGSFVYRWRSILDLISRMALDPYDFLCVTWYSNAHEAAQLLLL